MNTIDTSIANASEKIAPTWPLDQFIAVNPYWGFHSEPIANAAAKLNHLSGAVMTMPRAFYKAAYDDGQFTRADIDAAITLSQSTTTVDEVIAHLSDIDIKLPVVQLMTTLVDQDESRQATDHMLWTTFVTHQISQHCAAYFDCHQATWQARQTDGLYATWRQQLADDYSAKLLMGFNRVRQKVGLLPATPLALITAACEALNVADDAREAYFHALYLSINGWASWCAYQRWQAGLKGQSATLNNADTLVELLAIRLGWEWLLAMSDSVDIAKASTSLDATSTPALKTQLQTRFQAQWQDTTSAVSMRKCAEAHDWVMQLSLEMGYQRQLCQALTEAIPKDVQPVATVQAVFCIDVRSEIIRRALESTSPAIQTLGFAGFFGLPIAYSPVGTALTRPQLPGLLAAAMTITDESDDVTLGQAIAHRRQANLQSGKQFAQFRTDASSGFSFMESLGLSYAAKLLSHNMDDTSVAAPMSQSGLRQGDASLLRPRLASARTPDVTATQAAMAKGILGAMGITRNFARLILLTGHGSQSANNPHAAGLDCGACGGQTGEVNARALAILLNDADIRFALISLGINIPAESVFVAGLHNTTTDDVMLYDTDLVPSSHDADLAQLVVWLEAASVTTRAERSVLLNLPDAHLSADDIAERIRCRANNWAEVRPEWALANNAAFIVAPRLRTQHFSLAGRSFLHDYDYANDPTLGILELIMTAPMIVTNWINMQYYASTVDNLRYGSGNKVLHNVVGGNIGVFEGNGGDLRIGLPIQSLYDGDTLRHTPLRLSVFIEAPASSINTIINKHKMVAQLIDNAWLHLFRIDSETNKITRYCRGAWQGIY
jgi:uncharacterized protein